MDSRLKVKDLKPGMENVSIRVRVLRLGKPHTVQTRAGMRTLSEALVGDSTGRVRMTLWGRASRSLREGAVFDIEGAWVTVFRGRIHLNAGSRTRIREVPDEEFPSEDSIPEIEPSSQGVGRRRSGRKFGGRW